MTDLDRPVHLAVFGSANLDAHLAVDSATLFEIGSISKAFTSTLVLQEAEAGRLDLDEPARATLPWLAIGPRTATITPRQLLAHRSGLVQGAEVSPEAMSEVLLLAEVAPAGAVGAFHYSNVGYKLLGLLLEAVSGRPYPDLVRERILEPLGMATTAPAITNDVRPRLAVGYEAFCDDRPLPPGGRLAPATWLETSTADGSVAATALDMTAFVRMLLRRGAGPKGRLLAESSVEAMSTPWAPAGQPAPKEGYGFGIALQRGRHGPVLRHGGGMVGYRAELAVEPEAGIGVIVLSNGPGDPGWIARAALELFRPGAGATAALDSLRPDPWVVPDAAAHVGRYGEGPGAFELVERDPGHLWLVDAEGEARVSPAGPDALLAAHPRLDRFPLESLRTPDRVSGFHHGGAWYGRDGARLPPAAAAEDAAAVVGHYRSYNPWFSHVRVVARQGRLVAVAPGGTEAFDGSPELVRTGTDRFRLGSDPATPEVIHFDQHVGGRAMRACLSGGHFHRTAAP